MPLSSSNFTSDKDFCTECGTILPLPVGDPVVTCKRCGFQVDATEFDGMTTVTKIIFNRRKVKTQGLNSEDFAGPTVDKKCPQCGNDKMTYATRQTRSADEGQTVFYTCSKCKYQEIEYS